MKVTREEGFKPITIVLETEQDLLNLVATLRCVVENDDASPHAIQAKRLLDSLEAIEEDY